MPSIRFLAAAGWVTGSRLLVEWGSSRVLLDAGPFQSAKELRLASAGPAHDRPPRSRPPGRGLATRPARTFLVHGEPTALAAAKERMDRLGWKSGIPRHLEEAAP